MSLNDPKYFVFLIAVFIILRLLRGGSPRRLFVLGASYVFYFQLSRYYLVVLVAVTLVTYWGAILVRSRAAGKSGSLFFWMVCLLVIAPMILFKYLPPIFGAVGGASPFVTGLALPIGISFFTFAALGYLADVYLEVVDPETRFGYVACFVAFFPLVSAGPIERAGRLMPQFDFTERFSSEQALSALRTILTGLVLKVFLARMLALPIEQIQHLPPLSSSLAQFAGVIFYSFYLYADFAGYSLIAIGSAGLLGLQVRPNFLQPFLSSTVPEFWRTWHISLSFWVRDYLFTPLRMAWRRSGAFGMSAALLLSFALLGVWHGAKWGYLAFGLVHGGLVVASTLTLARRNAFWTALRAPMLLISAVRVLATFLLVSLAFVLYRADSLHEAFSIYRSIFSPALARQALGAGEWFLHHRHAPPGLNPATDVSAWAAIAVIIAGDGFARCKFKFEKLPVLAQFGLCQAGLLIVLASWLFGYGHAPFVYYQF